MTFNLRNYLKIGNKFTISAKAIQLVPKSPTIIPPLYSFVIPVIL